MKIIETGLTFDDVLLVPQYSEAIPSEVDISTRLTREISLRIPIISAAMDTVTEAKMAIAMARNGGIGIIHKNMTVEEQVQEVETVKRTESWFVENPFTLPPDATVESARRLMNIRMISGVPVVNSDGRLVGIVTRRDLNFVHDGSKKLEEVMRVPIVARKGISLEDAYQMLSKHGIEKLPVVDEDGRLVGLITLKDINRRLQNQLEVRDDEGRLMVGAAVSPESGFGERVEALIKAGADVLVVDTAHAHTKRVAEMIREIKRNWPETQLIAGNIATAEAAKMLVDLGVDAVKVGIGPGSICTTRLVAGVGVPQLTAIMDVAGAIRGSDVPIIADGGIKRSGDIVKAIAAGADSVMIGNLLAGTDESPGQVIFLNGRKFKTYRGMGSESAMKKGSASRYFQEGSVKFTPEGVEGMVPYSGTVAEVLAHLTGGLRSGMGYVGARNIKELQEKAVFIRITSAGFAESRPHDIIVTNEGGLATEL